MTTNVKTRLITYLETPRQKGIALMLLSVVLFAASNLFVRALGEIPGVDGWVLSFGRSVIGFLLVMVLYFPKGPFRPLRLITNPWLAIRGIVGATGLVIFYLSITHMGVARSILIFGSYPLFATLFAFLFLKEKIAARTIKWIVLSAVGLVFITGGGNVGQGITAIEGLAIFGSLLAGTVIVIIRKLHDTEHTSTIYAAQCSYGFLLTIVPVAQSNNRYHLTVIILIALAGLIAATAQLMMTSAFKNLSVSEGASMQLGLPVLTGLGGVLFFGEQFTSLEFIGGVFIVLGCYRIIR